MGGSIGWRPGFNSLVAANAVIWSLDAVLLLLQLVGRGITIPISI